MSMDMGGNYWQILCNINMVNFCRGCDDETSKVNASKVSDEALLCRENLNNIEYFYIFQGMNLLEFWPPYHKYMTRRRYQIFSHKAVKTVK
jgi:hypothetical protein